MTFLVYSIFRSRHSHEDLDPLHPVFFSLRSGCANVRCRSAMYRKRKFEAWYSAIPRGNHIPMTQYCTVYAITIGIVAPIGYVICAMHQYMWRNMMDPKASGRPRTLMMGSSRWYQQKAIPSSTIVVHIAQKLT